MFEVKGVAHSRFGRLTWDGGGRADIVYYDDWPDAGNYFPTGNRHEDEVFQHLWRGGGIAFYVGAAGAGGSEWEYVRCKFIGPMEAGIYLNNFNALDHWVWDSLFQNVRAGVTNYLPDRGVGAGGGVGGESLRISQQRGRHVDRQRHVLQFALELQPRRRRPTCTAIPSDRQLARGPASRK